MFWKMASVVVLGPPLQPQEELKFFTVLLAAIAFKTELGQPEDGPSNTSIFDRPGAIDIAISMSSETSVFPPLTPMLQLVEPTGTV
jgi:hypothetical protein